MSVNNIQDGILAVYPVTEKQLATDLQQLNEMAADDGDFDVIINLSQVEMINSSNISSLILLRQVLQRHCRELILYELNFTTRGMFAVLGLNDFFLFAKSKACAIEAIKHQHILG